jgi:hypothetical protein
VSPALTSATLLRIRRAAFSLNQSLPEIGRRSAGLEIIEPRASGFTQPGSKLLDLLGRCLKGISRLGKRRRDRHTRDDRTNRRQFCDISAHK